MTQHMTMLGAVLPGDSESKVWVLLQLFVEPGNSICSDEAPVISLHVAAVTTQGQATVHGLDDIIPL